MLGMDYTSSRRYFIQSSIIAEIHHKINPFLKIFFLPLPSPVNPHIFHKIWSLGKMPVSGKMSLLRFLCKKIMSPIVVSPQRYSIVENPCGKSCGECGKLIVMHSVFSFPSFLLPLCRNYIPGGHESAEGEQFRFKAPKRNRAHPKRKNRFLAS